MVSSVRLLLLRVSFVVVMFFLRWVMELVFGIVRMWVFWCSVYVRCICCLVMLCLWVMCDIDGLCLDIVSVFCC